MFFTIEEVGHSIEDPWNLHVLDELWTGKEDELRIEASINGLRLDTMERLPATDPEVINDMQRVGCVGPNPSDVMGKAKGPHANRDPV